ncbi:hypothetical protein M885DRAFT_139381 [Pelagophyceae sp. CCMP2097]|nr:hypothetical protein M885DRAFT_139381 [Pelagophyceae sp. CCMP2097]
MFRCAKASGDARSAKAIQSVHRHRGASRVEVEPFVNVDYHAPIYDVRSTPDSLLAVTYGFDVGADSAAVGGAPEHVFARGRWSISYLEAQCMFAGKKIAFVGDSVTRFHYFSFNRFISAGHLGPPLKKQVWARGEGSEDYDTADRWTDAGGSASHQQHFTKTTAVDDAARSAAGLDNSTIETQFWFLQDWHKVQADALPLFDSIAAWADVLIFNVGWWELKVCNGLDFYGPEDSGNCRRDYTDLLGTIKSRLFDKVQTAYFRTTSCCGEPDLYENKPGDAEL